MSVLEVNNLSKSFGGVSANYDITFSIKQNEVVGLIGPNGAGKTTLFNCIAGYHKPDKGSIRFMGKDITGFPPHQTNREGIARTFQVTESGGDLSVIDELMVGAFCRTKSRLQAREEAEVLLDILDLKPVSRKRIFELPVAMQKRVGLGRALATKPTLLMLDEVAAGLTPSEIEEIKGVIREQKKTRSLTVFVIEHVMAMVMDLSERVLVLDGGIKICEGLPEMVANDEEVIRAYLGEKYASRRKG
jgi:branched-chain amino acid transport system ATP-binding protein